MLSWLASWLWAVPAGRAGAWVLVQQSSATPVPSPLPGHSLLISPFHRSGGDPPSASPGPGGCVRLGWDPLLQRRGWESWTMTPSLSLGSQDAPPTPALHPPSSLLPHHPSYCSPISCVCLNPNQGSPLLTSPPRSWQEKQGREVWTREVGSG